MKIGRNAPCPYGSGKKYKKCCMGKDEAENLQYKRLGQAQQGMVEKMTKYVLQDLGDAALSAALKEFFRDDSDPAVMWQEVLDDFIPVFWPSGSLAED